MGRILNFSAGGGRVVVTDARFSPLRGGLFHLSAGAKAHAPLNDTRNMRDNRLDPSKHCLVSRCGSPAIPEDVGVVSIRDNGDIGLLATTSPFANCGVPNVRANAVGTTSNGASLCCQLVGPTSFSPGGGCPTVMCMCNNPRTRLIAGN